MLYRNQTNTMTQIQLLSQMRITTTQEAIAFLRAMRPINDQIAGVLQRGALAQQHLVNRQSAVDTMPAPQPTAPEPAQDKPFEPEQLNEETGYSEADTNARISQLKRSRNAGKGKKASSTVSKAKSAQKGSGELTEASTDATTSTDNK